MMADEDSDDTLRAMAQHRGFRLVKSRRRKRGVGDYGRYGLTQGGKEIFGFGANGLAATAEDIANFLRSGELSAWGESISKTPAQSKSAPVPKSPPEPESAPAARRESRPAPRKPNPRPAARPPPRPSRSPPAKTPLVPALKIRTPTRDDAEAIAALMMKQDDIDAEAILERLAALKKAGGAARVAQTGNVVGCVAWQIVQTLQHGPVGRITLLIVAERARRRGVGTALIEAAKTALEKQGCVLIEVMSDIEIRNSHGFFGARDFERSSYRFTKVLDKE